LSVNIAHSLRHCIISLFLCIELILPYIFMDIVYLIKGSLLFSSE